MRGVRNSKESTIPHQLLDAIRKAGSTGLCRADLAAFGGREASYRDELSRLFSAGKIFAAGSHIHRRWFWCEADALIWDQRRPRTQKEYREARRIETEEVKAARRAKRLAKLAEPRGKQPVWPPEHVAILREFYHLHGPLTVSEMTGHSRKTVIRKALRLGIKCSLRTWNASTKPRKGAVKKPSPRKAQEVAMRKGTAAIQVKKPRGPADMPGEPIFTERTKWTIAPPPPNPARTNTYSFL